MRIAFLCKRQYMGKDVIDDRYARLYEIPYQLARRGHDVLGLCLSYHPAEEGIWTHDAEPGRLRWESRSVGRLVLPRLLRHPAHTLSRLRAFRPDVIIGASDSPHIVLGARLAKRLGVPFVADLYDDFESFGLSRVPGLRRAYRHAVAQASGVTCTSDALAHHVRESYKARGEVMALPSAVDLTIFRPMDQRQCRDALGLPSDAVLIGTAGGLHADKGIGTLYQAFEQLQTRRPDVHLVLAGPKDGKLPVPTGSRVHDLGKIPHADAALLFNALDVGVIYLRDTAFGRFCFPQKAYEMLACGLPIVSAEIGAMASLLRDTPEALHPAENPDALAQAIERQLERRRLPNGVIGDWQALVEQLDGLLQRVTQA